MLRAYPSATVRDAEAPLLERGEPLMDHAAGALATSVARLLGRRGHRVAGTTVLLLVGSGDNGGDALLAGARLARRGGAVHAAVLGEHAHEAGLAAARDAGVRIHRFGDAADGSDGRLDLAGLVELARRCAVWVDGLTGIGVRGALREPLASAVSALDDERWSSPDAPLVVAVDVPSGLGVDDGSVPGPALRADLTVAMGTPKPCHLVPPACRHTGALEVVDLGLLPGLLGSGGPTAARLQPGDVADVWPVPAPDGHKYSRGVLDVVAGTPRFPGAAVLVVEAAHRAGVGMVRLQAEEEVGRLVLARSPEVVLGDGRAQAHVVGPGLDEDDDEAMGRAAAVVRRAIEACEPVVLDATGLTMLARDDLHDLPVSVVLTPHAGELATLLGARGEEVTRAEVEAAPARYARLAAEITGATVLLKGAVTVVAGPHGPLLAQDDATRWLSTAGAGDVLSGLTGALLAGHGDRLAQAARAGEEIGPVVARLAAAAALTHGLAARLAAGQPLAPPAPGEEESPGGPITSLDVALALPATVHRLLAGEGA